MLLLKAFTRQDGQAGILREPRIMSGEFTENKGRIPIRFDRARVKAIGAETFIGGFLERCRNLGHRESLAGVR